MARGNDGFPQDVRVRTEMNWNAICLGHSLSIGAAKLTPVDLSLLAACYQVEQKDNNRIDASVCRYVVSTSELDGLCFRWYSMVKKHSTRKTTCPDFPVFSGCVKGKALRTFIVFRQQNWHRNSKPREHLQRLVERQHAGPRDAVH